MSRLDDAAQCIATVALCHRDSRRHRKACDRLAWHCTALHVGCTAAAVSASASARRLLLAARIGSRFRYTPDARSFCCG